jgi:oxalate decarboxylase
VPSLASRLQSRSCAKRGVFPQKLGYVPSNAPHYIENTGDTDAVFLQMLASDVFEDVSLNQWLRRLPAQMVVQAHLGFDQASLRKLTVC